MVKQRKAKPEEAWKRLLQEKGAGERDLFGFIANGSRK